MPQELIATKGAVTANCYCTQDEAIDYLDSMYGADEWAQLSSDQMDRLILTAAKQIDAFSLDYTSLAATQGMNFPVDTGDPDDDGFTQAKEANILQAFYLFVNSDAMSESRTSAIQGITSETLGPTSKSSIGFNQMRAFSADALRLLSPYINLTFKLRRG